MKKKACIYCGTTEHLSASDIIPDALTNAKIINSNVCQDAHNSKFSDMFEGRVIQELAIITNLLDVKSSKGKNYARYPLTFKIDDDVYTTIISSETELFQKIHTSIDGKSKIGPIEQIIKMQNASEETVSPVDINRIEIEKTITIGLQVFFSKEMYRLVTKIAYEWYCLYNNIQENLEEFSDIIKYITTGEGINPVQFVGNRELYTVLEVVGSWGSHTLIAYIGSDNSVNIIVSLFGIVAYNVKLLSSVIQECKYNCIYQELSLDSKRKHFRFETLNDLINDIVLAADKTKSIGKKILGLNVKFGIINDPSFSIKNMYVECYKNMQNNLSCISSPTPEAYDLLKERIYNIIQGSALTIRSLKRFVKEHKKYWNKEFKLNPSGSDKKVIFLYYIVFNIGMQDIQNFSEATWYIKRLFGKNEIEINEEMMRRFENEMLNTENYQKIIRKGANLIESWKFE